jgi:hypothetical protein
MKIAQRPDANVDISGIFGQVNSSFINQTTLDIGPWTWKTYDVYYLQQSIQVFEVCRPYSIFPEWGVEVPDVDAATLTVRAFGIMAAIVSGIVMIYMCVAPCRKKMSTMKWKVYGVLLICSSVFQGICLMLPMSSLCTDNPVLQISTRIGNNEIVETFPKECQPDVGYRCGIVATALFFLTGIAMLLVVPPPRKVDRDNWCIYEDDSDLVSTHDPYDDESPRNVEEVKKLSAEQ